VTSSAVAAVIIATEHPERQGVRAGQDVEERFLFDRIAGQCANVAVGTRKRAVVVEAHAADAVAAGLDDAAWPVRRSTGWRRRACARFRASAAGTLYWWSISFQGAHPRVFFVEMGRAMSSSGEGQRRCLFGVHAIV